MNFSGCQVTEASEERLSSIDHIISAIQGLEAVTCRLELVLSRRLDRCRGRLGAVTDRLNAVENRIEKLCDSHRGILVLAPTKRPGRSELSLFHDFLLIEKRPIELSNNTVNDFLVRRQDRTAEKQLYYNVKVMKPQLSSTASLNLSSALWSVSNFLLFNSSFSPFQGCPTKLVSSSIELPSNIQNVRMASVSVSTRNEILDGDRLDRFNYTPGLSSVPQFEVPESLPDLPGVAELPWTVGDTLPSMVHSELVECKVPIESAACYDSEDPHFVMAVKEATVDVESTREIEQVYPAPVVLESGRSNLMDAIRRAGGAEKFPLRTVQQQKQVKKKKQTDIAEIKASVGVGGDMMADLAAALVRRRRGISGKNEDNKGNQPCPVSSNPFSSALAKIAEMIPKDQQMQLIQSEDWNSDP